MRHLRVENISKRFGNRLVLDDVSFDIEANEVIGLLGRNGAGKTTLLRIMAGVLAADCGRVSLDEDVAGTQEFSRKVSYLSERNSLYPHLFVTEYLEWIGAIYGIPGRKKHVEAIMDSLELKEVAREKIDTLSKGFRQRVGLAAAVVPDPEVLILDEPVNGLDPVQIVEYRSVIRQLAETRKIILSSHLMQEISELSDRIIFLDEARIKMDAFVDSIVANSGSQCVHLQLNRPVPQDFFNSCSNVQQVNSKGKRSFELRSIPGQDMREQLFDHVVNKGLKILSMTEVSHSLEDLFKSRNT